MSALDGGRLLITGVVNRHSIAFDVARQAQDAGADLILASFGRARRMTERAVTHLPQPAEVLELEINQPAGLAQLTVDLEERWGRVDGGFHAIGATA